jgi:hypothetical protein
MKWWLRDKQKGVCILVTSPNDLILNSNIQEIFLEMINNFGDTCKSMSDMKKVDILMWGI